jgi:hypothetical protein
MRYHLLSIVGPLVALFAACDITSYECREGAVCEAPQEEDLCGPLCDRLVACDRIDPGDAPACRDQCRIAVDEEGDDAEAGCRCVLEASCGREDQCDGAPLPPPSDDDDDDGDTTSSSGASGSGGSTSSSGAGGAGSSAGGSGGATACDASCECPVGWSCQDGYCAPASGSADCTTDCDCTSGDQCVDGACVGGTNR